MNKQIKSALALLLSLVCLVCLVACFDKVDATGVWEDATYRSDKEFGKGEKTVQREDRTGRGQGRGAIRHLYHPHRQGNAGRGPDGA